MVPADDQAMVFPCASVIVIMVLLKLAFTCATPDAIFLRSRRRTRVASLPILDPLAARRGARPAGDWSCNPVTWAYLLLLAGNRLRRTLAGAGVGVGALAAHGQAAAMTQSTVAAEVHQSLDVHGDLAPQVALDHIVPVAPFAVLEPFLAGHLLYPPIVRNSDFPHDFAGLFGPDPMDILQSYDDALVGRYVDAGDAGHGPSLLLPGPSGAAGARSLVPSSQTITRHPPRSRGPGIVRLLDFGCGLLMDSTASRQPPLAADFARGSFATGARAALCFQRRAGPLAGRPRPGGFLRPWLRGGAARRPLGRGLGRGRGTLGRGGRSPRLPQDAIDRARHLRDRHHAVDRPQHALELIVGHERRGLVPVGEQPAAQHLRIVVGAQRLAARLRVGDALLDALEQALLVHLELDHGIEREALLLEQAVERVGLRHRAREAVKDEALARIGLVDPVGHDADHDLVGHQLAAGHDLLGAPADRRAGIDRGAQHVAGRKLRQTVLGDEALGLRAFAGPRRAEQDQPHRRRPRSFDRLIRPSY